MPSMQRVPSKCFFFGNSIAQAADVDLEQIAKASPPTYTGADYYGFCANALLRAVKRRCEDLQDTVDAGDPYADPYSCDAEPLSLQNVLVRVAVAYGTFGCLPHGAPNNSHLGACRRNCQANSCRQQSQLLISKQRQLKSSHPCLRRSSHITTLCGVNSVHRRQHEPTRTNFPFDTLGARVWCNW